MQVVRTIKGVNYHREIISQRPKASIAYKYRELRFCSTFHALQAYGTAGFASVPFACII